MAKNAKKTTKAAVEEVKAVVEEVKVTEEVKAEAVKAEEPGLLLSQGISGSIPLEAENTESLSHTYF